MADYAQWQNVRLYGFRPKSVTMSLDCGLGWTLALWRQCCWGSLCSNFSTTWMNLTNIFTYACATMFLELSSSYTVLQCKVPHFQTNLHHEVTGTTSKNWNSITYCISKSLSSLTLKLGNLHQTGKQNINHEFNLNLVNTYDEKQQKRIN